jgi:hypothetical protein
MACELLISCDLPKEVWRMEFPEEIAARITQRMRQLGKKHFELRPKVSEEEAPFKWEVRKQFRIGLRRECSKRIWEKISENKSAMQFAEELDIDRGDVWRGQTQGQLSLESLTLILTILKKDWDKLSPIPPMEARAMAAYTEAMAYVRLLLKKEKCVKDWDRPPTKRARIEELDLLCLFQLHQGGNWAAWLQPEKKHQIADQIVRTALERLGPVRQNQDRPVLRDTVKFLDNVITEWGEAWLLTIFAIPYKKWGTLE